MTIGRAALAAGLALGLATGATAQEGPYADETITMIIATSPGGGYDTYARLIGKYLEDELGADTIVFRNMPGAGHLVGANFLAASEPDGLTIGTFNTGLIYAQLLQQPGMNFDLREMSWIGKAASEPRVMMLATNAPQKTFEDVRNSTSPVNFAAAGVGSASFSETKMLQEGFDLPINVIAGFNGNEGELAMLRGEVAGQVASLSSVQPFIDQGNAHIAMAIGGDAEPQGRELADTDKARQVVALIEALSELQRYYAAPPNTDPERLAALREGFMAVMENPDFLAEAEALGLPIDAGDGEAVLAQIEEALNQSPETVEIVAAALEVEVPTISATGPLLEVNDGGREIKFMSGDAEITAGPSGSRTTITIDGESAQRDQLAAGMECAIEYNPEAEDNEPVSIDCRS